MRIPILNYERIRIKDKDIFLKITRINLRKKEKYNQIKNSII